MRFLDGECHKFYYELVEVEKCMLQNKLIRKRERGDVLKRIKHVNSEDWLHPWSECEIGNKFSATRSTYNPGFAFLSNFSIR